MQTRRLNGATVRALREALGLRNRDLAERCEINAGFLTKLENGARQPSALVMKRLALGLGVTVEAISYPVAVAA